MKRHQSGAGKRKKILKIQEFVENSFIENFRNDYEKVMTEATDLSGLQSFSEEDEVTFNRRKRNAFFDENKEEYKFTTRDNFKINTFNVICDSIKTQLLQRVQKYEVVLEHFRIFLDWNLSEEKKQKPLKELKNIYRNDIDACNLEDELNHFLFFLKENVDAIMNKPDNSSNNKDLSFERMYKAAKKMSCTFPNIEILLNFF
ncbi:hypothetical protein HELRODRAFT_158645 [Helobdella robusta]|uniref:Uncharacterized protein n=1 Tax=Helobdella robusta TaxID=6412 RepID=T1EN28_HELRO|nr:hypothetical protein HELRODRAFT_158645 [Helobdella robusta]ESO12181.1 hypothetical protein HELRODRAFT_158645 [Helobdella robusta]